MSIDSKLFVSCDKQDVLNIGHSVSKVLDEYSRAKLDDFWQNNTDACNRTHFLHNESYKEHSVNYTNGSSISSYDFNTFVFTFGNGDKNRRNLFMFTDCSSDYEDIKGGYKVVFSIGYWGSSDEIIQVVIEAVKQYGEVYYDFNDCDDEDFVKAN